MAASGRLLDPILDRSLDLYEQALEAREPHRIVRAARLVAHRLIALRKQGCFIERRPSSGERKLCTELVRRAGHWVHCGEPSVWSYEETHRCEEHAKPFDDAKAGAAREPERAP